MAGYENIRDKGFDKRSTEEVRAIASKGGKASGRARRRKADFRKTLNMLLTAEIDSQEWTPVLEALGLESTLESAINMALIKEALSGNLKAYEMIAKYSGQTDKDEADLKNRQADTDLKNAQTGQALHKDKGDATPAAQTSLADTIIAAYEKRMEGGEDE